MKPGTTPLSLPLTLISLLSACGGADTAKEAPSSSAAAPAAIDATSAGVQVTAHDFSFDAPDSIASGWTRFRFENQGSQTHFFVLDHLPDGRTLDDFIAAAALPFDSAWHGLESGALDKAQAGALLGKLLPPWFAGVEQTGGAGLLAPGGSVIATVHLDPGTYVMECYVKAPDGTFHTSFGMARQLDVAAVERKAPEPTEDLAITFNADGMKAPAQVVAGDHTVAVHYEVQPPAGTLANDVHVARLSDGMDPEDLVPWMDWMNVDGLRAPAPATFLGGVQEVPQGGTAYFTLALTPGRYAWISENAERGMVQGFTVR